MLTFFAEKTWLTIDASLDNVKGNVIDMGAWATRHVSWLKSQMSLTPIAWKNHRAVCLAAHCFHSLHSFLFSHCEVMMNNEIDHSGNAVDVRPTNADKPVFGSVRTNE